MRRVLFRLLVPLLGLTMVAAACGGNDSSSSSEGSAASRSSSAGGGAKSDLKVGLVFDVGGRGDKSFNDSAYAGLERAERELGVQINALSPTAGGENREELLRTLADSGYEVIIGVGFAFADSIKAVAEDFPDLHFAIVDDSSSEAPNLTSLVFAEETGSYLMGVAAALKSTTGHVGFVGGVQTDLIKKFEAGYVAGAKATKADIRIDITYLTQPPDFTGFNNDAAGNVAAAKMYQDGADVVYHAAGASGVGVFQATKAAAAGGNKVWAIGVDSDQYESVGDPTLQPFILTSMIKRVDVAVFNLIEQATKGTPAAGVERFSLDDDAIAYSTAGGFVDDIVDQLDQAKADIIAGSIKVPATP